MRQIFYLSWKTAIYLNTHIKGTFLVNSQMWQWLIEIRIVPGIDITYLKIHPKLIVVISNETVGERIYIVRSVVKCLIVQNILYMNPWLLHPW